MRTSNPTLTSERFSGFGRQIDLSDRMTMQGTVTKTAILLLCTMITAFYTWSQAYAGGPGAVSGYMMLGVFGGMIAGFATIFKQTWAPVTAPIYALLKGLFLGGISALMEARYPGIVMSAVGLTFGVMGALLLAYQARWIVVTDTFRTCVVAATGGIALFYFISLILSFFGIPVPLIHSSGSFGILFSLFVVGIASMNLVLDFDFIEQRCRYGAPQYMEWYSAFGLMVTLIWLYIEILRLLAKLRDNR